jgi:hypothetical protein
VVKEMQQLHDRVVIQPRLADLKQKHCGQIKGQGCADGCKQQIYKTKEETSAPTVSVESLFLSCVIDAKEWRKVVTCNIPEAFMQADINKVLHVHLKGPLAQLLTKVDPEVCTKFLSKERRKDVLYVRLTKALYGTLQAALLFWKDLTGYLQELGFILNPYNNCITKKTIDGTQFTILWHMDNLKISHVKQAVLEDLVTVLNE